MDEGAFRPTSLLSGYCGDIFGPEQFETDRILPKPASYLTVLCWDEDAFWVLYAYAYHYFCLTCFGRLNGFDAMAWASWACYISISF